MNNKSIAILVFSILVIGLVTYIMERQENQNKQLGNLPKELPIPTKPATDTIFMGYQFGMSEADFMKHTRARLKSGELTDRRGKAASKITTKEKRLGEIYAVFSPDFHEDRLYKLSLGVSSTSSIDLPGLITFDLADLYTDKYGKYDSYQETELGTQFEWVDSTKRIQIYTGISDARVIYEDLYYLDIINQLQSKQDSISQAATKGKI